MKIAVNTGGGDAPGLNAVIRAVVHAATARGWEVYGVRQGYNGFFQPGGVHPLTTEMVRGITALGGTILGTVNKGSLFDATESDLTDRIVRRFYELGFNAFIAIGGDGSFRIAQRFIAQGVPMVCVPKTIDNDVNNTHVTFGFNTAVATATAALDKLHSTAEAHQRVFCVELMGRNCGWIALHAGLAATAEGARPEGGEPSLLGPQETGREVRLGGMAEKVARAIEERCGVETRSLVLGHLQRGGHPTAEDRVLALRYGAAAVRGVEEGKFGQFVSYQPPSMVFRPLADAIATTKHVPLNCDEIRAARELGICLGD